MTMSVAGDAERVTELLGRLPSCDFVIVTRTRHGDPEVIRNAPFFRDGTPMPTRYWLVDPQLRKQVSQLEGRGGVKAAEAAVDPVELRAAHDRYALERDQVIDAGHAGHVGPRPSGGVGGTRTGVKCLHTHYAWFLAGGDDPVGRWVHDQLHAESDP
jgi:hypothetical protein